jgi:hypothetical protein
MSDPEMATVSEVAVTKFAPLLGLLADVPDPRRAQGQIYKLPHVLLFSILAIVTGANSYRGIVNPNYGYASRRWLVSEMEGLPGLKA